MSFPIFSCFHSDNSSCEASPTKLTATDNSISHSLSMSHYIKGCNFQSEGKLDEAIKEYHRAIAADSNFCDAHFNLANGKRAFYIPMVLAWI